MKTIIKEHTVEFLILILLFLLWHPGLENRNTPTFQSTDYSNKQLLHKQRPYTVPYPFLFISLENQYLQLSIDNKIVASYPLIIRNLPQGRYTLKYINFHPALGKVYCFTPLEEEIPLKELYPKHKEVKFIFHTGVQRYDCIGEGILEEEAVNELYPYMQVGTPLIIQS